jgi:hypothetical protein
MIFAENRRLSGSVISFRTQKFPVSKILLTFPTQAKKVQAVIVNSKPRLFANLILQFIETDQLRVHNLPTPGTDYVRMGKRLVPVVSVTPIGKAQFENLVEALEQGDSLVDGGQACGREGGLDLFEDLFSGRMILTGSQNPKHGQTLGGDTEIKTLELVKHLLKAVFTSP